MLTLFVIVHLFTCFYGSIKYLHFIYQYRYARICKFMVQCIVSIDNLLITLTFLPSGGGGGVGSIVVLG